MKPGRTIAALAAAAAMVVSGCGGGGPDSAGAGGSSGTLTLGSLFEPTSFDPSQAQEGNQFPYYQAVYDALIRRMPDGSLAPMLAKSWEYDATKTTLTLELRDDVTFSDGARFDAAAAKANLEHFRSGAGPQGSTMAYVDTVEAVDPDTLTISLTAPDPGLLTYLSNAAGLMGSPAALGSPEIKTNPIGSGPYTLDVANTVVGSRYIFVKREGYWNPELQHYGTIVIQPMADVTARYNALVSGQVQATLLDARTAEQAEQSGLVPHLQTNDWAGLIILDRAGTIIPALADARVRQAINHAIDAGSILKEIGQGMGEPTDQIFSKRSTAYLPDLDSHYAYDPARAKQLMDEAGVADGFTVDFPVTGLSDPALIAVISEQLAAVGIRLNLVEVPIANFITEMNSGRFAITAMFLFQPSTWVTVQQAISPSALFNALRYSDPVADGYIGTIQRGTEEESAAAAKQLNDHVVEQAWFAPWYRVQAPLYASQEVQVELQAEQAVPSIYGYRPAT